MEYTNAISSLQSRNVLMDSVKNSDAKVGGTESFDSLLTSFSNMIKETESASNAAQKAELEFMLGLNDNVHDLLIAQQKANITLQYTVAIRNAAVQAYQEIMQMQF
ncbi:MAG: flagellar hook-basal body complex protein FliE [Lachnospiraceae bacterium]|nr:flagellar hook-basal body complex protein FliE [Lachnospiraceae bacterium]